MPDNDTESTLDSLAREMGLDAAPTDVFEQPSEQFADEADTGPSGAALADELITRGHGDLAQLGGPTLQSWQKALHAQAGDDLETVAAFADAGDQTETFIQAAAKLQDGMDFRDLDTDPNSREARFWLGADGALTENSESWLNSDDDLATTLRREWGGNAGQRLNATLKVYFSGAIPPTLLNAFAGASVAEQLSGLRLLDRVAQQQKGDSS
jgi:hypothetical protein